MLNGSSEVHLQDLARCLWRLRVLFSSLSYPYTNSPKDLLRSLPCLPEISENGILALRNHPNPEFSRFLQKGFSEISCEIGGRALHGFCLKMQARLSVFHTNTLINMYSKFGRIGIARYLFDVLPDRNESSWNTMISGYVRAGLYGEALDLFNEMMNKYNMVNGLVIANVLTACSRINCPGNEGFQIQAFALKCGLLVDLFVGTSLLHFYGTYGFICCAVKFFEEMPIRNVVSWTSLMVVSSENGYPVLVIYLYNLMKREGVAGNENTFSTVISSCAVHGVELVGCQVIGDIIKSGFFIDISVSNSVISLLGDFANVERASHIFDHMDDYDTVSWNSIISVFAKSENVSDCLLYFNSMRSCNEKTNPTAISSLLSACTYTENIKWGKGIHGLAIKTWLDMDVCVCNTLLTMYSLCGGFEDAKTLFKEMPVKDLITWNAMMSCYVQYENYLDAVKLLSYLFMNRTFNHVTFATALVACSNAELISKGKILHALVVLSGLQNNLITENALITMYGKAGMMEEAKLIFATMRGRDLVTWNAMIGIHADNEEPCEALKAFKSMRGEKIDPNYITIVNVLSACSDAENLFRYGKAMHASVVFTGFELDYYVGNSLIMMYAKCGDLNSSNQIFDGLSSKSTITWNTIISGIARHGNQGEDSIKFFSRMLKNQVHLDQFSFCAVFVAAADLALLEEGQQLHSMLIKLGYNSDLYVLNAAMDMYGKCGEIDYVLNMVPHPRNRLRMSWNILISAFARHGHFRKAVETFHEMVEAGFDPDHVTFVSLLSACSHGGLVDEGLSYFSSMSKEYGILPGIKHCACIVDLLGRKGRLLEAEKFINEMPVSPNGFVWRSLLAACKLHRDVEMGKVAVKRLVELNSHDDSAYVLYSNMCATTGRWSDVESVRRFMSSINVKKIPACSWMKLKNKVISFGMGDSSHPQNKNIFVKLREIMEKIKELGYVPDTSFSLHDMDEEQKECSLWNHSEKLALAFGLINTPEGFPLKIFKNLRVCGDCHSVYKFVSQIVGRKIMLRDPYRFHHFVSGECSCGDYW